jgi:TetR/AcrR family transcriptional regulator, cholesterol catabolism regulator
MDDELKIILEKVLGLYQKYGIKSITMDDVSRELGISKKTLYQYVTDKTDLVSKVLDLELSRRKCEFEKMDDCERNAIEEMIDVHRFVNKKMQEYNPSTEYDLKKYYPDLYRKYHEERHQKMYEKVLDNMKRGKEQGIYRAEMNEEIIAKLTVMRTEFISGNETYNLSEITSQQFFTEIMIYHIRGIANEAGLKILEENIYKMIKK